MDDSSSSSSSDSDFDDFTDFLMFYFLNDYNETFNEKVPQRTSVLSGEDFVKELLGGHERTCYELLRMDKNVFNELCTCLKQKNYIKDTREIKVEEAMAIFLIIVGQNMGMRFVADRFQHSLETIDRHFHSTLKAICKLGKDIIRPTQTPLPSRIINSSKYYPWFQNCIGAIDGTHVSACVPQDKQVSYRGRKGVVTQNVLCACNFDMFFTFVSAGWEGTANDSRIFIDAITKPEYKFPLPKEGEYYVVDSGFPCTKGFLPPYRGERYHLQEYNNGGNRPRGKKELFNYRHSSLRNVIERCFGVLKARFPILKMMPRYKLSRQTLIVIACCTLHNFIRQRTHHDHMFREWEEKEFEEEDNTERASTSVSRSEVNLSDESAAAMARSRDRIAQAMWSAYTNRN
ncbi:protein ALP1-like [Cannabis sativa]|uniref:protein ALP1-like n=2 Tax=Cannabis sativa TaxID=3483 RepID=UPI0029CA1560|nr:protein ALP1-like [Cannabis sativa]XP_060971836.1 protein ALP1-like [Cannabis sativa]